MELVIWAGIINWLATWILVDAEVFRELRDGFVAWTKAHLPGVAGRKAAYLVRCQLCCGTWVGLGMAALLSGPLVAVHPAASWFLNGLLYKGVGHLILEAQALAMNHNELLRLRLERERPTQVGDMRVIYNGTSAPVRERVG